MLGGSVALHLGTHAHDRLAAALQRSPALAGREVEVVRLALGGWKQPQQLLAVELLLALGGHFDCVVNLDGFNEVALAGENVPLGVPAWFPRSWARLLDAAPTREQLPRLGRLELLREQRTERAGTAAAFAWSPLAQFVWLWRDRALDRHIADLRGASERAAVAAGFAVTGPGPGAGGLDAARDEMVALWRRASAQLHAVCAAHGAVYCHFLQPNQYVPGSKPMGPEESARALRPELGLAAIVARWYPALQREGAALRAAGVAFTDLTGVFREHAEPRYVDPCCHLDRVGNQMLAEHVAAAIRVRLEVGDAKWTAVRATPARVELDSPFADARLALQATTAAGAVHDVTGVGFGARFSSLPAGFAVVTPDGRVRAAWRGGGTLRVELGAVAVDVPVAADWAPRCEARDGRAAPGAAPPHLVVGPVGEGQFDVQCANLPPATFRLLVASPQPLPDSPVGVDTLGMTTVPIPGDAPTATLRLAHATAPGRPLFVRVVALAPNAVDVVAASNTVVLTPP